MIMLDKIQRLIIHSSPIALGLLLSFLFWRRALLLLVIYLILVFLLIATGKEKKTELLIFIYGLIVGFLVEAIGTQVSGYQSFAKPDIWGLPYWLIVSWGYGFILMKRVGLIITTGLPWTQTGAKK